ncbi:hypothetical protein DAPPUDRAFT_236104 [Daphnia pulex]|uniref:Peptidase S1 domain-containing protein n=1 Tax=Daphnia pulex TaxID=6669 RepID=E9FZZ3_DAPPU|nr:hypothetical protein DAPPUDRAFT_236104 [Daphnia pulex]|eukprot:EFX87133.1 hypothetical protein DAPPUDRAFT_236104 [Daphnia pulex]
MILAVLSLLAVASIRAKNIGTLRALPDIGSVSPPRNQWYTLDEQRRANFGYAYPGQAASNIRDADGNMAGSWSYVDADGNLVRATYTADKRGFLVSSTNEGRVAPNVLADLSKVGTTPKVGACNEAPSGLKTQKAVPNSKSSKESFMDPEYIVRLAKLREGSDFMNPVHCSGSLISTKHVLTAAYCVTENNSAKLLDKGQFEVNFGKSVKNDLSPNTISKISIHPDYDYKTHENDIAIITLDTPVTLTEDVALVCLVPECFNSDDAEVMAMGWGQYKFQGKPPTALGLDFLKAMSNEKCKAHLKGEELPSSMNDYGGPLVVENKGDSECRSTQIGIVTYGNKIQCIQQSRSLSVYTKVASFLPWIAEQTAAI